MSNQYLVLELVKAKLVEDSNNILKKIEIENKNRLAEWYKVKKQLEKIKIAERSQLNHVD